MPLRWPIAPQAEAFAPEKPTLVDQAAQSWDVFYVALQQDWKALIIFILLGVVLFFGAIWMLDFRAGRARTSRADKTSRDFADMGLTATKAANLSLENQVNSLQNSMTRIEADSRRRERHLQEEIRDLQKSHADKTAQFQNEQSQMRETIRSIQHASEECHRRERVYVATFGIIRNRLDPEAAADVKAMLNTLGNTTNFQPFSGQ